MSKKILAALIAVAALLTVPSVARADYYINKAQAKAFTRDYVASKYGTSDHPATACRPQGRKAPEAGYIYHRWVCGWAEDNCGGAILIKGSRTGHSYYYGHVWRGITCN